MKWVRRSVRHVDSVVAGRYDGAVKRGKSVTATRARCARCRREIAWHGNPHRPFCSLSCRLIDLGVWLDERYRIPGPSGESSADDNFPFHDGG